MAGTIHQRLEYLIDQALEMDHQYPDKIAGQVPVKAFLMDALKGFFQIPDSLRTIDAKYLEIIWRVKS